MWYWAITTLSTIGFGDYSPQSFHERMWAIPILMFGVIIFSLIISQFLEIIQYQTSIGKVGDSQGLTKWVALLSRFNNGHPMKKELITQIEDFFDYYWLNNRLFCL